MVAGRRILIASGGTGGHFYPGFALAEELRSRGWQPLFLVKKGDIARPALDSADLPYTELDMTSLPRSLNPLALASFALKLLRSVLLARRILADFRPDAVLGTGSYIGFPAVFAAALARVPVYIHESNAIYGLANKLAGRFCTRIFLGLPVKNNPFEERSVLLGTPVRAAFSESRSREGSLAALGLESGKPTMLVFGGSQGARRLNSAFAAAAKALKSDIQAVHITGKNNFGEVQGLYEEAGLDGARGLKLFDYREDMQSLYAAADLVIARAGASTIAELVQLKKPAILVPLPSSLGNDQRANALALAEHKAAVCIGEDHPDFEAEFLSAVRNLGSDPAALKDMRAAHESTGIPPGLKAAAALADAVERDTDQRR